jgi:hypothetical protein
MALLTARADVYRAIDSERAYQDRRWNHPDHGRHSIGEWLVYIDSYLSEAKQELTRQPDPFASADALETIRKIAGMCVACMEDHGAPMRIMIEGAPGAAE